MRILLFTLVTILAGCSLLKEKHRVEIDSLAASRAFSQWELRQKSRSRETSFDTTTTVQELFIEADAPFEWRVDQGFSGEKGRYHMRLVQKSRFSTEKVASAQQQLTGNKAEKTKRIHESVALERKIRSTPMNWKIVFWIGLLALLGFCFLRWWR